MLMFFFDQDGPLLIDFLQHGTTVMPSVTNLWPPFAKRLNRNDRQAHPCGHSAPRQCMASYVQHNHGILAEIQMGGSLWPSIQSRPLSLQLCHFWTPKKALRGKRFILDDVKQYARNWFTTQSREFYETAIHSLVLQWDKCLNIQGQYFWHTGTGFCS